MCVCVSVRVCILCACVLVNKPWHRIWIARRYYHQCWVESDGPMSNVANASSAEVVAEVVVAGAAGADGGGTAGFGCSHVGAAAVFGSC